MKMKRKSSLATQVMMTVRVLIMIMGSQISEAKNCPWSHVQFLTEGICQGIL